MKIIDCNTGIEIKKGVPFSNASGINILKNFTIHGIIFKCVTLNMQVNNSDCSLTVPVRRKFPSMELVAYWPS